MYSGLMYSNQGIATFVYVHTLASHSLAPFKYDINIKRIFRLVLYLHAYRQLSRPKFLLNRALWDEKVSDRGPGIFCVKTDLRNIVRENDVEFGICSELTERFLNPGRFIIIGQLSVEANGARIGQLCELG